MSALSILMVLNSKTEICSTWSKNRQNPMYMLLSDYCGVPFHESLSDYFSKNSFGFIFELLKPINAMISNTTGSMNSLGNQMNLNTSMLNSATGGISSVMSSFMSMFTNIISEFQVVLTGLADSLNKSSGIVLVLISMMNGLQKAVVSLITGPPGDLVGLLTCFHPNTEVKMQNTCIKKMKDIILGDVLENGSVVEATMNLNNHTREGRTPDFFYKIKHLTENKYIYVTGTHKIFDSMTRKFINVADHWASVLTDEYEPVLVCINTSDHKIPIGGHIFWDWEDDLVL
jgi:hypothetical protein